MKYESAFPHPERHSNDPGIIERDTPASDGITIRDYFAAKAMHAIMQRYEADVNLGPDTAYKNLARSAYSIADAMLSGREKP